MNIRDIWFILVDFKSDFLLVASFCHRSVCNFIEFHFWSFEIFKMSSFQRIKTSTERERSRGRKRQTEVILPSRF